MAEAMVAAGEGRLVKGREGKYLTFSLSGEEYGIGILKVKEIIGMMAITRIPQAPAYVKGVINLRGKVIPVIDLRSKFGLDAGEYTERTCVVVVEVSRDDGHVLIGSIVDSVSEVLNIREVEIEETPDFGTRLDTRFILGMAKVGSGIKILLDIDKVLGLIEAINQTDL
jgi:purine-binding chemotaxis protein CheW